MSFPKLLVAHCRIQNEIHIPLCDVYHSVQLPRLPSSSLLFTVHSALALRKGSSHSHLCAFDHAGSSHYTRLPSSLLEMFWSCIRNFSGTGCSRSKQLFSLRLSHVLTRTSSWLLLFGVLLLTAKAIVYLAVLR